MRQARGPGRERTSSPVARQPEPEETASTGASPESRARRALEARPARRPPAAASGPHADRAACAPAEADDERQEYTARGSIHSSGTPPPLGQVARDASSITTPARARPRETCARRQTIRASRAVGTDVARHCRCGPRGARTRRRGPRRRERGRPQPALSRQADVGLDDDGTRRGRRASRVRPVRTARTAKHRAHADKHAWTSGLVARERRTAAQATRGGRARRRPAARRAAARGVTGRDRRRHRGRAPRGR